MHTGAALGEMTAPRGRVWQLLDIQPKKDIGAKSAGRGQDCARKNTMDRDAIRRSAQDTTLSSLRSLATAFAGDETVQESITVMMRQVKAFDVKPAVPAVGVLVIGELVSPAPAAAAPIPPAAAPGPSRAGSSRLAPEAKRPRRMPAAEETLHDYPPHRTEVLLPRQDGDMRWNDYCLVIGHVDGMLLISVPGEDEPLQRSLHSLRSGLGKETRPLKRPCDTGSKSSSPVAPKLEAAPSAAPSAEPSAAPSATPQPRGLLNRACDTASASPPAEEAVPTAAPQPRSEELSTALDQLAASALRRSSGRTREQLNAHLASLPGLSAKFGVPVVSKLNGVVSHLTFNVGAWNDLPRNEDTPFEWWLGAPEPGKDNNRLRDANLINPHVHAEQSAGGYPLFFAAKRQQKGGALCCYGGHFTTRSFRLLNEQEKFAFKAINRQAKIELAFSHYDEALAAAVNAIPE